MNPIIRWTIGPVKPDGFHCLTTSIKRMQDLYDATYIVCHNNLNKDQLSLLEGLGVQLIDQRQSICAEEPLGVAWKLYPQRLGVTHELFIDNDLVIQERLSEIDRFFDSDSTLLLQGVSRNYGRFSRHVPKGLCINSGLFGVPPALSLADRLQFYGETWTENCFSENRTWDEQGFVATALSNYREFHIISNETIVNCETTYCEAPGLHFVGLNRSDYHHPYRSYVNRYVKIHL